MQQSYRSACIAEALGTFMLVLAGTGAIVVNESMNGVLGHAAIAVCFGLVVLSVIYTIGEVSGAHINPAVTIAFWVARRFPGRHVPGYIISQLIGAIAASAFVLWVFPTGKTLGATLPTVGVWQTVLLEVILSWWLMYVILGVSEGAKEKGIIAGLVIGGVVALEAMFAGPLTGASMNPARSTGPALIGLDVAELWIYWLAPVAGTVLAVFSCRVIQGETCCQDDQDASIR